MDTFINIFWSPTRIFDRMRENPKWTLPFVIILVWVALTAAITVTITRNSPEALTRQEEIMRDRGMTDEQIEQAMQVAKGPIPIVAGSIVGAIFFAVRLVLFALILNLFIPLFGGANGFKQVFAVVSYSALVMIPGSILRLILMGITRSPFVATSLAVFVQNMDRTSFFYGFLGAFDLFVLWEMVLVALGISCTNSIKRANAYTLVFAIWFVSIFIGIGLQALGGGR
ncbi:YIP1 family protein [candidate division WOR-3 bacterium]|nr:YIP1 family protein [candidate division WOR-3 bacterium]